MFMFQTGVTCEEQSCRLALTFTDTFGPLVELLQEPFKALNPLFGKLPGNRRVQVCDLLYIDVALHFVSLQVESVSLSH